MADGTYFDGKRFVKAEDFVRPDAPPKPPKKRHPNHVVRKDIKK